MNIGYLETLSFRFSLSRHRLWLIAVGTLAVILITPDLLAIVSGVAVLTARQLPQSCCQKLNAQILHYAQSIAPTQVAIYNQQGILFYREERLEQGMDRFRQGLAIDPQDSNALSNLGVLLEDANQRSAAIDHLQAATNASPDHATIRYNLGLLLAADGNWLTAERSLREATRIAPAWASAYAHLANTQLHQQQYEAAGQAAEQALTLAPHNQLAYYVLLQVYDHQKRGEDLLHTARTAHELYPDDPAITFYYALALHLTEQEEKALPLLQEIFFSSSDHVVLHRVAQEILSIVE